MDLTVTRASVHAADEPPEVRPDLPAGAVLGDLVAWIVEHHYLPTAGLGGTWVLSLGGSPAAAISKWTYEPTEVAYVLPRDTPLAGHPRADLRPGHRGRAHEVAARWAAPAPVPAGPVEHPALDFGGEGFAATETRAPVVFLDRSRSTLLEAAGDAGKRAVLVTDEVSVLTPALASVWQEAGAAWVVRSATGLREGFTGRRLAAVADVLAGGPAGEVAIDFLRPGPADALQAGVAVSVRRGAVLGGVVATVASRATGSPPASWGAYEPLDRPWDPAALTAFVAAEPAGAPRPAGAVRVLVGGPGLAAVLRVGADLEVTEAHLALDPDRLERLLDGLAAAEPVTALVHTRPGRADLLVPSRLTPRPTPVALLLGPAAARELGVAGPLLRDPEDLAAVLADRGRLAAVTGLPPHHLGGAGAA